MGSLPARVPRGKPRSVRGGEPAFLLTTESVAQLLDCSQRTAWRLAAAEGGFPRPVRLTRRLVRWKRADVEAWLAAQLPDGGVGGLLAGQLRA